MKKKKKSKQNEYNSDKIKVFTDIESIRHNPEMYIDTVETPSRLFDEIIDNAIDELDYADTIRVIADYDKHQYTVFDNGRGIPLDDKVYEDKKLPTPILLCTKLFSSGKFDKSVYKMSAGLHGVGLVVVNALSKEMNINIIRNNKRGIFYFKNQTPFKYEIKKIKNKSSYTKISFIPDDSIFDTLNISLDHIINRLHSIMYYDEYKDKKIELVVIKDDNEQCVEISNKDKLLENALNTNKYFSIKSKTKEGEYIEVHFSFNNKISNSINGYVNVIPVHRGTHVKFFLERLTYCLNSYFNTNIETKDVEKIINIVVISKIVNKRFQPQTKVRLVTPIDYFNERFKYSFNNQINKIIKENKDYFKEVIKFIEKIKHIKAFNIKTSSKQKSSLNKFNNLKDCLKHNSNSELIIVEGSSAGEPLRRFRDELHQAILLLHGKIINTANNNIDKIRNNRDIKILTHALGINPTKSKIDINKLRYGSVYIAADADPDGKHIVVLVLTVFAVLYPELLKSGYVRIIDTPLYGIRHKKTNEFKPIFDYNEFLKYDSKKYYKLRFKGLGSMDEEIYDVILDRNKRRVYKVVATDDDINFILNIMSKGSDTSRKMREILNMKQMFVQI